MRGPACVRTGGGSCGSSGGLRGVLPCAAGDRGALAGGLLRCGPASGEGRPRRGEAGAGEGGCRDSVPRRGRCAHAVDELARDDEAGRGLRRCVVEGDRCRHGGGAHRLPARGSAVLARDPLAAGETDAAIRPDPRPALPAERDGDGVRRLGAQPTRCRRLVDHGARPSPHVLGRRLGRPGRRHRSGELRRHGGEARRRRPAVQGARSDPRIRHGNGGVAAVSARRDDPAGRRTGSRPGARPRP